LNLVQGNYISLSNWIGNALLIVLFYEPIFALSVVIVGWCQVVWGREVRPILALTFLLLLSLWIELLATIALNSFAGALAAAIVAGSR
jgi:ABC-type proline/glycine betaine transport system permease subunit